MTYIREMTQKRPAKTSDLTTEPGPRGGAGNAGTAAKVDDKDRRGAAQPPDKVEEVGGPEGPEPTRYGDWEVGGRCTDF